MNLTLTITVTEDENISVQTRARDVSEAQVRPILFRALHALQAEIDALEDCPFHKRSTR
jgi:hypothetical protein